MSGVLKGLGKAFKSVGKIVKKVALPALAIGAVIATGGAAIGALPALGGAGGILASVGIKGALAGVITSAAKAATFGAIGSAITGGDPIKGATMGLVTGGVLGGIGALAGGAGGTAGALTTEMARSNIATGLNTIQGGAQAAAAGAPIALGGAAGGIGAAAAPTIAATAGAPVAAGMTPVAGAAGGGGILGFMNNNPIIAGQMIQGIGGGLMANERAKAEERDIRRIRDNYSDTSGLFRLNGPSGIGGDPYSEAIYGNMQQQGPVAYDRQTKRIYRVGA
jgi:hypothetical protein